MDTQTLLESLRKIKTNEYEWTFCLYTAKKSRDGIGREICRCAMKDIASLMEATITLLLEKTLPEHTVSEYSPFLSKEAIGVVEQSNEYIQEPMSDILSGIRNALQFSTEDFLTGVAPNPNGTLFYGIRKDENGEIADQVLFMKRSNPFMKSGKSRLCISENGEIVTCESPVLKFTLGADLILADGMCYILSQSVEKDLGLEERHVAITAKRMGLIAENSIVNNYEELEKAAYAGKNVRKFLDFDREVLDYLVRLPLLDRADFLSEYGLTTDKQGLVDTNDDEQCELLIDLLCGRSCHDALGRLSVGSNILPR